MKRLPLNLMLMILLIGCSPKIITTCPQYPLPNAHVREVLSELSRQDPEVKAWGNRLLNLCQQLGTCKLDSESSHKP